MSEEREVRPWDYLKKDTKYASKKVFKQRMDICKNCEHFFKLTKQCKICLCIMPAKANLADASCPKLKWFPTKDILNADTDDLDYEDYE